MYEGFSEYLKKQEIEFEEYKSIGTISPMKIDSAVRFFVSPENEEKLIALIEYLKKREIPFKVVGRMSNILFKTALYDGVIIQTTKINTKYIAENKITISCGAVLPPVIRQIAEYGLGGFEGLAGIPGTVGGMLRQNAGAFGYEISECFSEALIYDTETSERKSIGKADMDFSYRKSILENSALILLSATFTPVHKTKDEICETIRAFAKKRGDTQPISDPSLGSVFKRCDGISAGYYIDRAGLKGMTVGGAQISHKHAGFIVNRGDATADDVLRLIENIKRGVYEKFGIELCEEIEIV